MSNFWKCSLVSMLLVVCSAKVHADDLSLLGLRTDTYSLSELNSVGVLQSEVDLLFVVDNSGSMAQFQSKLIQIIPNFIAELRILGVNAKIGITSTDEANPLGIGMVPGQEIYSRDVDAGVKVSQGIQSLGTRGSGTEMPFAASLKALSSNPGYKRPSVPMWTIFFTDAREQSGYSAEIYWARVTELSGAVPHFVSMVLSAKDLGCESTNDAWGFEYQGSTYQEVYNRAASGTVTPICGTASDLESSWLRIARPLSRSKSEYSAVLNRAVPATIQVFYRGVVLKSGTDGYWTYDASQYKVIFKDLSFAADPVRDQISITYEIQ